MLDKPNGLSNAQYKNTPVCVAIVLLGALVIGQSSSFGPAQADAKHASTAGGSMAGGSTAGGAAAGAGVGAMMSGCTTEPKMTESKMDPFSIGRLCRRPKPAAVGKILCLGTGGGSDAVSAFVLAESISKKHGVMASWGITISTQAKAKSTVQLVPCVVGFKHVLALPDAVVALEADPMSGGTLLIAQSIPPTVGLDKRIVIVIPNDGAGIQEAASELATLGFSAIDLVDNGGDSVAGSVEAHDQDALTLALVRAVTVLSPITPVFLHVFGPGCDGESTADQMALAVSKRTDYLGVYPIEPDMYVSLRALSMKLLPSRTPNIMLAASQHATPTFSVERVYPTKRAIIVPTLRLQQVALFRLHDRDKYLSALLSAAHAKGLEWLQSPDATKFVAAESTIAESTILMPAAGAAGVAVSDPVSVGKWMASGGDARGILGAIADGAVTAPYPVVPLGGHGHWCVLGNKDETVRAWNNTDAKWAGLAAMAGYDARAKYPNGDPHPRHFFVSPTAKGAADLKLGLLALNAALAPRSEQAVHEMVQVKALIQAYIVGIWGADAPYALFIHLMPRDASQFRLHIHVLMLGDVGHSYAENDLKNVPLDALIEWMRGTHKTIPSARF